MTLNENDYQLGIRGLSKHDLVMLVNVYRNEIKDMVKILNAYVSEDLAKDIMHKVISARESKLAEELINDYDFALKSLDK